MNRIATRFADAFLLQPRVFGDERGFFLESWNRNTFAGIGLDIDFVQDNHSRSAQGILRGLHYQTQHTQGKLVRVLAGSVYDVIVDLRRDSPTFGQWQGFELSAANNLLLWVPRGFAHGFYVQSASADFFYKCDDFYDPASEVSLAWNDATLAIDWPLVDGRAPTLSAKDQNGVAWADAPKF